VFEPRESCSEEECFAAFEKLFPRGFSGPDVLAEAPLDRLSGISSDDPKETERNIRELVGRCLWDIFSDNHDVITADGRALDLGSFRGSGGFLADYSYSKTGKDEFDYIDFYLGNTIARPEFQTTLLLIYEMIFRRLKRESLDWIYHFPRLNIVDLRPLRDALNQDAKPDWQDYSPSEAFAKEEENRRLDEEIAEMRRQLEESRNAAIEEALKHPPPATVQAYRNVYGRWPKGWPPEVGEE